jgi:signal transduction histidine kinase/ActR/RegA family two-component response regulator
MGKTPIIIHVLRALIALLLMVMLLFGTAIFLIQNKSKKNIVEATQVLNEKNKPLEILDLCIQQIYSIDNDFRMYTLSFSKVLFDKYKNRLKGMDSLTTALQASLSSGPGYQNSVYSLQSGNKEKEAMQASFGKLRRMADSLLNNANSLQSIAEGGIKPGLTEIKQYNPDLTFIPISTDTINLTTEETKKKKGFFSKVKTFFKGETQTTKTKKQIISKSGAQTANKSTDQPITMVDVGREVARQTNTYYENKLKEQFQLNEEIKQKEKALIELNSSLMSNISAIFRELKRDNLLRDERVQNLAVVNILKYSRIVELCVLGSIGLAFLLTFLIALNIRKIIKYQKGIIAGRTKAEDEAAEKSKFLAFMSHELRTPLTSIVGFTEQLKESNLDPVQQTYLQAMSGSSDILLTTVNDILDMSKLDSGKFRFVKFSFPVQPVIAQVLNSLQPMAEKKGMKLELISRVPDNLCFVGDEMRLKQVIINLVNNAIKYSDKGTVTVTILVEKSKGKSKLQVEVADQGIGIDEDSLKDVFNEFSQVHEQSSKKWIIGTGLGLPICKKIVEQQEGKIWVTSIKGEGSTFSFSIPYQTFAGKPEEPEPAEIVFDNNIFVGKNILAADDTEINLVLLDSIFKKWGVVLDKARNGAEALQLFKLKEYHIVISDVYMPEMDGIELTRQIRSSGRPANKNVPVIILSANMIQDEIEKFKLAGVNDYLPKPFMAKDLYKIVSKYLKQAAI